MRATFWLLNAPASLQEQSRRNPDGTGIGTFTADGEPVLDKQPMAAWQDGEFATQARTLSSTTFVAHVRYASTGGLAATNTHPFVQDGRLLAHNGVVGGLDRLDARIRELGVTDLVRGETDSERVFAVISGSVRRRGGDVDAGLVDALTWLQAEVPIFALNLVLTTATHLWALRYPDVHDLLLLERRAASGPLDARSDRIRSHAPGLADRACAVVATRRMDDEDGWNQLDPGVVTRVDPDLTVHRRVVLPDPPTHQLHQADLDAHAAASQHGGSSEEA